jgi:SWI/SNF-related matrix-associated actin-dependent regulator of chromatin subfamily A-like protein 1
MSDIGELTRGYTYFLESEKPEIKLMAHALSEMVRPTKRGKEPQLLSAGSFGAAVEVMDEFAAASLLEELQALISGANSSDNKRLGFHAKRFSARASGYFEEKYGAVPRVPTRRDHGGISNIVYSADSLQKNALPVDLSYSLFYQIKDRLSLRAGKFILSVDVRGNGYNGAFLRGVLSQFPKPFHEAVIQAGVADQFELSCGDQTYSLEKIYHDAKRHGEAISLVRPASLGLSDPLNDDELMRAVFEKSDARQRRRGRRDDLLPYSLGFIAPTLRDAIFNRDEPRYHILFDVSIRDRISFIKNAFESINAVSNLDGQIKENYFRLLSMVVDSVASTYGFNDLLAKLYREYAKSIDVRLVPLFKALHLRSDSKHVIEAELELKLFAHWGLRDIASSPTYQKQLREKLSQNPSWIPVKLDISKEIEPAELSGTHQTLPEKIAMVAYAYQVYGGPVIEEAEQYFQVTRLRGGFLVVGDLKGLVTEIKEAGHAVSLQFPMKVSGETSFAIVDNYFSHIYGDFYALDKIDSLPMAWAEDIILSTSSGDVTLSDALQAVRDNKEDFTDYVLSQRGIVNLTIEEVYPQLRQYYEEKGFFDHPEQIDQRRQYGSTVAFKNEDSGQVVKLRRESIPFLLKKMARGTLFYQVAILESFYGSHQETFYPLELYTAQDDEERIKVAESVFKTWIEVTGTTFDDLMMLVSPTTNSWIPQDPIVLTVPTSQGPQKCIISLVEIFNMMGIGDLDKRRPKVYESEEPRPKCPPFWKTAQLQLFYRVGLEGAPSLEDARDIEVARAVMAPEGKQYISTIDSLPFVYLVQMIQTVLTQILDIDNPLLITSSVLDDRIERDLSFLNLPFVIGVTNMRFTLYDLVKVFRRRLAADKKGIRDINQIKVNQSKSLISSSELVQALRYFVYSHRDLSNIDEDDILSLIDEADMRGVVAAIGDDANDIAVYLSTFQQELVKRYGLDNLVKAFVGLKVNRPDKEEDAQEIEAFRDNSPLREETFTAAILDQLARRESVEEESLRQIEFIYKRILRRWVEEDSEAALDWIASRADGFGNPHLKQIFENLYDYFADYLTFTLPETLTTEAFGYQVEAIRYFSDEEHKRGMLLDEPGMGKTLQGIGIAEVTKARKVLWVTTASNKHSVKREVLKHTTYTEDDVLVLEAGKLKEQLRNLDGRKYLIINYASIRKLQEKDPEGYALLTKDLDVMFVDEGQLADNEKSQQGEAVQDLAKCAERLYLLSATPIQNRFERIYNQLHLIDAIRFPNNESSREVFMSRYTKRGAEGFLELHHLLQPYVLRRLKEDTFKTADPDLPLEDQGMVLPAKNEISYKTAGGFFMTEEQAQLYVDVIHDYDSFLQKYYSEEEIKKAKRQPFHQLNLVFDIVNHPEKFGLGVNPRKVELKRNLKAALENGQKPIIWAHHQAAIKDIISILEELAEEHPELFPKGLQYARYDGSTEARRKVIGDDGEKIEQREIDLLRFQESEDSEPRIFVGSLEAGGVGLTITAGNPVFFYEQSYIFTRMIQAFDRNHRVDGRFPRYTLDYTRLIAQFPPGFLDSIESRALREVLSHGTIDEMLYYRLESMTHKFKLVMDGLASEDDLNSRLQADLMGELKLKHDGQNEKTRVTYASKRVQRVADNAASLAGAYQAYEAQPKQKQAVVDVVDLFIKGKVNFEDLIALVKEMGEGDSTCRALITTLSIRKKYYAQRFLRAFLPLLNRQHKNHGLVSSILDSHFSHFLNSAQIPDQLKALLLPLLCLEDQPDNPETTRHILGAFVKIKDRSYQSYWAGRLFVALNHLNEAKQHTPDVDVLAFFKDPIWHSSEVMQKKMIESLYLWSQVSIHYSPRQMRSRASTLVAPNDIHDSLLKMSWHVVAEQIGVREVSDAFKAQFHHEPHRVLAIFNSLETNPKAAERSMPRLQKYFQLINEGHAPAQARGVTSQGYKLFVHSDKYEPHFRSLLKAFEQQHVSRYDTIEIDDIQKDVLEKRIQSEFKTVQSSFSHALAERFGHELEFVTKRLVTLESASEKKMRSVLISLKIKKQGEELTEDELDFLTQCNITADKYFQNLAYYKTIFDLAQRWGEALSMLKEKDYNNPRLRRNLSYLISEFGVPDQDETHYQENALISSLQNIESSLSDLSEQRTQNISDVEIVDTNDPYLMMQIGDFHPTISNCLAADGAPYYLEGLSTLLGSQSQRVIVAKVKGEIAAMGKIKVRADKNGRPAYYLEFTVFKGFYDFRDEFVAHLIQKAQLSKNISPRVIVGQKYSRGLKGRCEDFYGIGGFGEREHEEAVYNMRNSKTVHHKAKVTFDPLSFAKKGKSVPVKGLSAQDQLRQYGILRDTSQRLLINPAHQRTAIRGGSGSGVGSRGPVQRRLPFDSNTMMGGTEPFGSFGAMRFAATCPPIMPKMTLM